MVNGKSQDFTAVSPNYPFTIDQLTLEVAEEGFGVVEEVAGERDVLDLFVADTADGGAVEAEDVGAGQRHQDRRVRGDDELRVLLRHPFKHREECQLALRRERRLRLVEQVEAARDEARLEEVEEALAVRARVGVLAVAIGERAPLPAHDALREPQPVTLEPLALELAR